jgi:hypothetical protein
VFYVFAYDSNSEGVVHSFVEEVTIELDNVGVVLSFEKLNGFFLTEKLTRA